MSGKNYLYAANARVVYPGAEPYPVFVKVYRLCRARYRLPASLTPTITSKRINPAHNEAGPKTEVLDQPRLSSVLSVRK